MSTYNYYSSLYGNPPTSSGTQTTTMNDFVVLSKLGTLH